MTINEIAQLAGVSRATVSRYLNNGYVSEEKRARIRQAIEQTGYVPSVQAQNLRSKKTKLVGVIIPKINSDTVSRMVAGISEVLKESGYQLLLGNAANDVNEELRLLELFQENQVDGVIFCASIFTAKHEAQLKKYKIPLVLMGQYLKGYSCVYHDDYTGARLIAEAMLKKAKTPCYIGVTEKDVAVGKLRRAGYADALAACGLPFDEAHTAEADFTEDSGYRAMQKLYAAHPSVDTLICATDSIAVGAMNYLREIGVRIPQDVQVAGMDDTSVCKWVTPTLSSVHFYYKTCGIEAAKMLLEKLQEKQPVNKEMKMGCELFLRDSAR